LFYLEWPELHVVERGARLAAAPDKIGVQIITLSIGVVAVSSFILSAEAAAAAATCCRTAQRARS